MNTSALKQSEKLPAPSGVKRRENTASRGNSLPTGFVIKLAKRERWAVPTLIFASTYMARNLLLCLISNTLTAIIRKTGSVGLLRTAG